MAELTHRAKAGYIGRHWHVRDLTLIIFTNTYQTKAGKTYYFCYDQGYIELEPSQFTLVWKKEYID